MVPATRCEWIDGWMEEHARVKHDVSDSVMLVLLGGLWL